MGFDQKALKGALITKQCCPGTAAFHSLPLVAVAWIRMFSSLHIISQVTLQVMGTVMLDRGDGGGHQCMDGNSLHVSA